MKNTTKYEVVYQETIVRPIFFRASAKREIKRLTRKEKLELIGNKVQGQK